MAIKIKRGESFFYAAVNNLLDEKEKARADKIYNEAKFGIDHLNRKFGKQEKPDFLAIWYWRGILINKIINKFKISENEKKYFWLMLYGVANMNTPDRAKKFHIQNDFRVAGILANYPLKSLQKVGRWNLWREIIGSTKIGSDERVARWVTNYIFVHKIKTKDCARPLLKAVRNRLKKIDTSVLNEKELKTKLKEVDK